MKLTTFLFASALAAVPFVAAADSSPDRGTEAEACRQLISPLVDAEIQRARAINQYRYERHGDDESSLGSADTAGAPRDMPKSAPRPIASSPVPPEARPDPAPEPAARESNKKASASRSGGGVGRRAGDGPSNYSRTNTQEAAVEEGDIVKTNGRVIFHVSCNQEREASGCKNELRIYSSWPASESKLLGRFAIPGPQAQIRQLYMYGDNLAVLTSLDGRAFRTLLLDVSTPATPRVFRDVEIDGNLIESRMIGSRLYFATQTPAPVLPPQLVAEIHSLVQSNPSVSTGDVFASLAPRWRAQLEAPSLPRAKDTHHGYSEGQKPIFRCSDVNVANTVGGGSLLNVVQLDVGNFTALTGAAALGYSAGESLVYASEGAFYVADPAAPNGQPWYSATLVRKFELGKGGQPRFVASGLVRGRPLNQFALSEHNSVLRVATSDQWMSNNLYVLRTTGNTLETIGTLENLGQNERIYAVRMMGDRGYIVTFRRTDPLYTLDLSSPTRPRVVGELKIEGYSNYLHPLGGNHLLAIGQDADAAGRPLGLHLQVFDVTDAAHPVRKFHEKLAAASISDAQTDHHAFMFEPETNTLSVPWKSEQYWGLVAYRVDPREGFVNLGRVNHALMYKHHFQKMCARADSATCGKKNFWYGFVTRPAIAVDRIIAIDAQLYSLSPSGMMIHRATKGLPETNSVLVTPPSWTPSSNPIASRW